MAQSLPVETVGGAAQPEACCVKKAVAPPQPSVANRLRQSLNTYQPLIVIFLASLAGGAFAGIAHGGAHAFDVAMRTAMGLFLLPLAILKLFDLQGFARGFAQYDPLSKVAFPYGYVYPFLELGIALLLIAGLWTQFALALSIPLLGLTAIGIAQSLSRGIDLNCACVGAKFGLPLGKISLIENAAMAVMAAIMLAM